MVSMLTSLLLSLLAAAAFPQAGGSARSWFKSGSDRTTLSSACALLVHSPDELSINQTLLYFSSKPLDCAAARLSFDPSSTLATQAAASGAGALRILVSGAGEPQVLLWSAPGRPETVRPPVLAGLELVRNDAVRIEGRYLAKSGEGALEQSVELSLEFALDVLDATIPGRSLPKDGGALGAAYRHFTGALKKAKHERLRSSMTEEAFTAISHGDDDLEQTLALFRSGQLEAPKILAGRAGTDRGILRVEGKRFDGERAQGTVYMLRVDGEWLYAGASIEPSP